MKEILIAHYNEKTITELYSELGSLVQGNKEGPTDFLIRAMDLRNKILLDSNDTSELKYDPELVHGLFCRSVKTGLRDMCVRQEFKTYIETRDLKDEDLIQALTRIVSRENERRTKRGRTDVHSLSTTEDQTAAVLQGIAAEMQALKAEVAQLRQAQSFESENSTGRMRPIYQTWGCPECKRRGMARSCRHCWSCGGGDHRKQNCPTKTQTASTSEQRSGN